MNARLISLLLILTVCLFGCDTSSKDKPIQPSAGHNDRQVKAPPSPAPKPATLLVDALDVALVETATAALPIWRDHAPHKPALVLFSNQPFLDRIPEVLLNQAIDLVRNGTSTQIDERAVKISANPLLMHTMAVSAALQAGLFSELIWILPVKDEGGLPPLETFRQAMLDRNLVSQAEAESFAETGDHYTAVLRGVPATVGTLDHIPHPQSPAWVHIDVSFFQPLYVNEVSTPIYPLVLNSLRKMREGGINSIGATISQSNLGGALSLKIRFLGNDLSHLLKHPASIDAELPELQFRRAQNLYLEQFVKKEEVVENCLKMEALAPNDPSVKFELYNAYREINKGTLALEALAAAVAIDPMYAYEYLYLAETAAEKKRPDAALNMLEKARQTFSDNPLVRIMEADINIELGRREAAVNLLSQLQTLPWSKVYDQDMPGRLEDMKKIAEKLPASP